MPPVPARRRDSCGHRRARETASHSQADDGSGSLTMGHPGGAAPVAGGAGRPASECSPPVRHVRVFRSVNLSASRALPSPSSSLSDHLRQPTSPAHPAVARAVMRPSPHWKAVRLSDRSPRILRPFVSQLMATAAHCRLESRRALVGSRADLPYRAVRSRLRTTDGQERLRCHGAGSTLPRLRPADSSRAAP